MQSKVSVVLLKSKTMDNSTDINKMSVHLEQILAERDRVDLKVRQGLTDANIRSADFIVFCGYDSSLLSDFFKAAAFIESTELGTPNPILFLYEEPGQDIWEHLNYIFREGVDLRRINPKIFDKVISCWSYRDIVSTVDIRVKQIGIESDDHGGSSTDGGDVPAVARA